LGISVTLRLAFGRVDTSDHRYRRLAGIVQGLTTGLVTRGLGILISLVSVPLTIGYLGQERYGVLALIGSVLAWARLADFGIGNGLTNCLTAALARERLELARAHITTAIILFTCISLGLGVSVALAWPWIDWSQLFGVRGELARAEVAPAVAAAIVIFLMGFPLSTINRVYIALQQGRLGNYWGAVGRLASLLALVAVTQTRGGLIWLIIAVSGTGLVVTLISGGWLFIRHKPALAPRLKTFRRESTGELLHIGGQFFLIQIMALVVFETDNIVIGHYLGAAEVAPYSITYSLFAFTSIIQSVLFSYVWVGHTDAIARGDIDWVSRTFRLNLLFSLGFTLAAVGVLVFIARPFIRIWAGAAVVPSEHLVYWLAGWSMINAFCSPIACLLAAASHMKAQVVYSAASTVANLTLSVYLVQRWGIDGVIAATVFAYLVFVCIPTSIDVSFLIKKLRHAM
jgi:O-antigen/teichoic acid export membrane protein